MTASPPPASGKAARGLFYGWVMVACGFALAFVTGGLHAYTRGIFLKPIAESLGASRLELSLAFTVSTVVMAVSAPLIGWLMDRLPMRPVIAILSAWIGCGYLALSNVTAAWQMYAVYGLFFGIAFHVGGLGAPKLIVNWFTGRRALALSIVAMGASAAGVAAPPLATMMIEAMGWRAALVGLAGIMVAVVVPVIVLVRDGPAVLGLVPYGADPAAVDDGDAFAFAEAREWRVGEVLRQAAFWALVLIFGTMSALFQATSTHLFAHLTDIGVGATAGAAMLSLMALLALLAKPVYGLIADRSSPRLGVVVALGAQLVAMLGLVSSEDPLTLTLALAAFGFGYGGMNPLRNAMIALAFGRASFGRVAGFLRPAMLPLTVAGIPFAGWIHDTTGSYRIAFVSFAVLYIMALAGVIVLGRGGRPPTVAG